MSEQKNSKAKKIVGIIGNILIWVFVAFSAIITILVFAAQNSEDGVPELGGQSLITIETKSMEPTFMVGDMIILEKLDYLGKTKLEKGDIITYHAPIDINGDGKTGDINTHRIESIDHEKGIIKTKGDGNLLEDSYEISYADIIGTCEEDDKIAGLGNVINFLRSSLGFFLCIVLPLILFFLYELYNFISIIVTEKAKKKLGGAESAEELKRKAIEEYLRSQGLDPAAAAVAADAVEVKKEEPKPESVAEPVKEEPKAEELKAEEPKVEEPKAEEPKAEEPKVEEPKAEAPKVEEPKVEEPKAEDFTARSSAIQDQIAALQKALEEEKAREEARLAEEARKAEEARLAEEARKAEEARLAEEARKAEEARLAEEARKAEEARLAEEARKAEEARLAEEAKKAEEAKSAEPQKIEVSPEMLDAIAKRAVEEYIKAQAAANKTETSTAPADDKKIEE